MAISEDKVGPADAILGAQIRAARMSTQMRLRTLSRTLGVSPATVSQIENGKTGLSVARLRQIAEALNLNVAQVLAIDASTAPAPTRLPPSRLPPTRLPPTPAARYPTAVDSARTDWRTYVPLDLDPVLSAALDEFVEIGYDGASMRTIATRSGLSVSGIYHHFASKQQMLVTLLELAMVELQERAEAARGRGRTPMERFSLLIENLALYHTHRRELGFVGASEMRSFDAENRSTITERRNSQRLMVDAEVEAAVREGHFRGDDPYEASRAVVTMC